MSELSETRIPPGGWQYFQPQTKWSVPNPISVTLNQATDLLVEHRQANPQFDLPVVWYEVKQEIMAYTRRRLNIPDTPPIPEWVPQRSATAAGVAERAGKTAAGVRLVVDWLGTGLQPVGKGLAEQRAAICATCPKNQAGDLWQRLEGIAAENLRRLISIKGDMELATSQDAALKTCVACDCHLPLKVWAPLTHVLKHTKESVREQLDPRCWILKEAQ